MTGRSHAPFAQRAGGGLAVHHRHLHVHQQQVEGLGRHAVERDLAVFGLADAQAHFFEQHAHQLAVLAAVVDHQHMRRRELPALRCHLHARRHRLRLQRDRLEHDGAGEVAGVEPDAEGGAVAGHAARHDVAAHGARKTAADGQAQPGAAEAPRRRRLGLHEGLEHRLELVGRNADAAVHDVDAVAHAAGRALRCAGARARRRAR